MFEVAGPSEKVGALPGKCDLHPHRPTGPHIFFVFAEDKRMEALVLLQPGMGAGRSGPRFEDRPGKPRTLAIQQNQPKTANA